MKKLIFTALLAVLGFSAKAQNSLLASLTHDGTITTYYGTSALAEAHSAAVHGDVITLSAGSFTATDITKAITLRGAGMHTDSTKNIMPTIIQGDFNINIEDSLAGSLCIEGIFNNNNITYSNKLVSPRFQKCRLNKLIYGLTTDEMENATFVHCRIIGDLKLGSKSSAMLMNCIVEDPGSHTHDRSTFEFINCVLNFKEYSVMGIEASTLMNCIIMLRYNAQKLDATNLAFNNVGINATNWLFENITNTTNSLSSYEEVFKTFRGGALSLYDNEDFELTEEAKAKFRGTDGTEIGIYGGSLPYDPITSTPQITKCKVAPKSDADGKLSVEIEVNIAE